ncbi:MAG TPA: HAMP domain-containing sensor histidine kinase [Candidatus Thermoplasmatota archaeon]|nr:HAMP domain-containing sensor histidine kinase [Candidatus Thermoplasmatota archaeon]
MANPPSMPNLAWGPDAQALLAYVQDMDEALAGMGLNEALDDLLQRTRTLTGAEGGAVLFPSAALGWFYTAAAQGIPAGGLVPAYTPLGRLAGQVLDEDAPTLLGPGDLRRELPALARRKDLQWLLGVPMAACGQRVGVLLAAGRHAEEATPHAPALLHFVAKRSAAAILQARSVTQERRGRTQAERLSDFRNHLLHMASHDLRSPLSTVKLQARALGRLARETGRCGRAVALLERNLQRLEQLLNDFLDLARLEAGHFILQERPVALAEVLQDVLEALAPQAAERGIQLSWDWQDRLRVRGDARRLQQVFTNLVGNSLRYSRDGGHVHVDAAPAGEGACVTIRDDGIGLTPDQVRRLFRPFAQVHGHPAEAAGAGLGLYLSSLIVQEHGGTIRAESPGPGRGAVFRVWLPLATPHPRARTPAKEKARLVPRPPPGRHREPAPMHSPAP